MEVAVLYGKAYGVCGAGKDVSVLCLGKAVLHDAAAADIARKMKEAAQNRLGRIPVTEVLVYLD